MCVLGIERSQDWKGAPPKHEHEASVESTFEKLEIITDRYKDTHQDKDTEVRTDEHHADDAENNGTTDSKTRRSHELPLRY
jgi:hypothetical protein